MSSALDLTHDGRTLRVKQLHADLDERLTRLVLELVEEVEGSFRTGKIAGYDYVLTHS